ncbi:uncharacterized protein LOC126393718 [Scomber scombrus]|uniref:Uncharacterized protein LOC126393718 n=1 Tax=Scomber scombrus TaxID=13677 RepID=A0AAV1N8S8_SCOSC
MVVVPVPGINGSPLSFRQNAILASCFTGLLSLKDLMCRITGLICVQEEDEEAAAGVVGCALLIYCNAPPGQHVTLRKSNTPTSRCQQVHQVRPQPSSIIPQGLLLRTTGDATGLTFTHQSNTTSSRNSAMPILGSVPDASRPRGNHRIIPPDPGSSPNHNSNQLKLFLSQKKTIWNITGCVVHFDQLKFK